MKHYLHILIFFVAICCNVFKTTAGDTTKIPINRLLFHENIIKEQNRIDLLDGLLDSNYSNPALPVATNNAITRSFRDVPTQLRYFIEADTSLKTNNDKIRYLRYVQSALSKYTSAVQRGAIAIQTLPDFLQTLQQTIFLQLHQKPITVIVQNLPYEQANIIANVFGDDNSDSTLINNIIYTKFATANPDKILSTIQSYLQTSFADSLLEIVAKKYPIDIYTYAQSETTPLGSAIHSSKAPLVKLIAEISKQPQPLLYFPFLDNLNTGNITLPQITTVIGNSDKGVDTVAYYKLLVKTAIDYAAKIQNGADTPIAYYGANGLKETLKTRALRHFVKPINDLHEIANPKIRYKAIEPLNAQDLYYMLVMGENDIFTSSYRYSFDRLLDKLPTQPKRTDSLLLSVNNDYLKKFIKLAANYNKLDTFLKLAPPHKATVILRDFVNHLENSGSLEDAVDVADSYSSITDTTLRDNILFFISQNKATAQQNNNTNGILIYGLLETIFNAVNSGNTALLSTQLGIPSIYEVPYNYLKNDSGKIVEQVFFYGDDDGKKIFNGFRNSFNPTSWTVKDNKFWIEANAKNNQIDVFANKPLDTDNNWDDTAQYQLNAYLLDNNKAPSIVVHRGHSYWLDKTIRRMPADAKIVILGSCGGYQNLQKVLEGSPNAHIISTKEIGSGYINKPILDYLHTTLAAKKDVNWQQMWQLLTNKFKSDKNVYENWESYIPPYQNLGAIFLKAYKKQTQLTTP